MADVLFLAITAGFFGLVTLLVRGCDAIIGADPRDVRPGGDPPGGARRPESTDAEPTDAEPTDADGTDADRAERAGAIR